MRTGTDVSSLVRFISLADATAPPAMTPSPRAEAAPAAIQVFFCMVLSFIRFGSVGGGAGLPMTQDSGPRMRREGDAGERVLILRAKSRDAGRRQRRESRACLAALTAS